MNDTGAPPERGREEGNAIMEAEGAPVALRPQWRMMLHETDCRIFKLGYFGWCNCKGPETLGRAYVFLKEHQNGLRLVCPESLAEILARLHR